MRWRLVLIGSVGLLLLGLQAHGFAQSVDESAQQVPSLFLTPSEGPPATMVTASGNGYCESGTVTLRWGGETRLVVGQADEGGDISLAFSVPEATLGTYTVTSDSMCRGSTRRAETSFTVVSEVDWGAGGGHQEEESPPAQPRAPPVPPQPVPPRPERPQLIPQPAPQRPSIQEFPPGSTLVKYEELIARELERGAIVYNPPERMRVDAVNRVEVRISREVTDELSEGLQGEGTPSVEELLVGTLMRAKLEGNTFSIMQIGSEVQQLSATGFREWRWDVTPNAAGDQPLFLTISVLHEDSLIWEEVFERRIDVAINPSHSFFKFLRNSWEPLSAALVGVVALAEGLRRLWRRQQQ